MNQNCERNGLIKLNVIRHLTQYQSTIPFVHNTLNHHTFCDEANVAHSSKALFRLFSPGSIHTLFTYLHINNYFWFGFFFSRTQLVIEPVYELDETQHSDENAVVASEHTDQELSNKAALTSFTTVENEKQTTEAVNKGALTDFPCQSNQEATTSNTIIENETTKSVNDDEVSDIPCTSAEAKENEAPKIAENQNQR